MIDIILMNILAGIGICICRTYPILTLVGQKYRYALMWFVLGFFISSMFLMANFKFYWMGGIAVILVTGYSIMVGVYDCKKSQEEMRRLMNE
jgi:uncharacterized membrane protein